MEGSRAIISIAMHEAATAAQAMRDPLPPPQNGGDQANVITPLY